MKQKIVPTSPKSAERQAREEAKALRRATAPHLVFGVVVATLLIGSMAGFFGFVIAANVPPTLPVLGQLNVVSLFEQEREDVLLSVRTPSRSIVQQAPQVIDQVVAVYSAEPTITEPAQRLGNAVVLTSDGWLAVPTSLLPADSDLAEGSAGVAFVFSDGEVITVQDTRIDDPFSGMSYVQVPADALSPVEFSKNQLLNVGQTVSVIEQGLGSYVVYRYQVAGELADGTVVRSTDKLQQLIALDTGSQVRLAGAAVFSGAGELAGILMVDGSMVHSSLVAGSLKNILAFGEVDRPGFTVRYVNIARLTESEKRRRELPDSGILILAVEGDVETGLKKGDVIRSINTAAVETGTDFGAVIHSQVMGSTLYLSVLRDEVEQPVEFVLEGQAEQAAPVVQ